MRIGLTEYRDRYPFALIRLLLENGLKRLFESSCESFSNIPSGITLLFFPPFFVSFLLLFFPPLGILLPWNHWTEKRKFMKVCGKNYTDPDVGYFRTKYLIDIFSCIENFFFFFSLLICHFFFLFS